MLETERMWLCAWEPDDWRVLAPIVQDAEVARYLGDGQPFTEERVREFVQRQCTGLTRNGFCMWQPVLKATGEPLGFCGLQPLVETELIEIGWVFARTHWKHGLAREAARAAMRFGFASAGLPELVAVIAPPNAASIRVAEALGMRYRRQRVHQGFEVAEYAMSKEQWSMTMGP